MASENTPNFYERVAPILIIAVVGLSFATGALWQKVGNLQGGNIKNNGLVDNTNENNGESVLNSDFYFSQADKYGISKKDFESCLADNSIAALVENDYQGGIAAGVTGTPGNFLINQKGEAWYIPGAVPLSLLKTTIDNALNGVEDDSKLSSTDAAKLIKVSDADHIQGSSDAELILIEYSDYQCPYCQSFHQTAKEAIESYNGRVAWVYRHFPLDSIHPAARPAAIASECIAKLGSKEAFWNFSDAAFGMQ